MVIYILIYGWLSKISIQLTFLLACGKQLPIYMILHKAFLLWPFNSSILHDSEQWKINICLTKPTTINKYIWSDSGSIEAKGLFFNSHDLTFTFLLQASSDLMDISGSQIRIFFWEVKNIWWAWLPSESLPFEMRDDALVSKESMFLPENRKITKIYSPSGKPEDEINWSGQLLFVKWWSHNGCFVPI